MESVISTPRLKLTLIEQAEQGSQEFEWLHEIYSNKEATWWSLQGRSPCPSTTSTRLKDLLPTQAPEPEKNSYKIVYAVHEILTPTSTKFIGLINLHSLTTQSLPLPAPLTPPSTLDNPSTLSLEIAYMYLPSAWNKGYASESIGAVFAACGRVKAKNFWDPYQTVYVRALVNEENPASARVTEKVGMKRLGVHVWKGNEPVVIAGKERWEDRIVIFGGWVGEAGLKAEDEG